MKKYPVVSRAGADSADSVVTSLKWMRYSPLCCPLYYLLVLSVSLVTFIVTGNSITFAGVVLVALMALRWKCFLYWGQRAALISSRRVFVRGATPAFGLPISQVIMKNLVPYRFTFLDGKPASKLFLADNFSLFSLSWRDRYYFKAVLKG